MADHHNPNRYRNALLGILLLGLLAALGIWVFPHPFCNETACPPDGTMSSLELAVLAEVNKVRTNTLLQRPECNPNGILSIHPSLAPECHATHYARMNSTSMSNGEEAHKDFCERATEVIDDVCGFEGAAEIAAAFPMHFETPNAEIATKAVKAWLCSPKHRDILLSNAYNSAGVAVVKDGADVFWITMFLVKKSI